MCSQDDYSGSVFTGCEALGIEMARPLFGLMCGTWEPTALMRRETFKWQPHKNKSTDAEQGADQSLVVKKLL